MAGRGMCQGAAVALTHPDSRIPGNTIIPTPLVCHGGRRPRYLAVARQIESCLPREGKSKQKRGFSTRATPGEGAHAVAMKKSPERQVGKEER